MKLFIDEDAGPTLARTLISTGFADVDFVAADRAIKPGTYDEDWIPYAGRNGFLVLTKNKRMLRVQAQRELLVREKVGIVFLPNQATSDELARLTLDKQRWLEHISASVTRPFAFAVYRSGQIVGKRLIL